ncbi:hypothetical protein WT60_15865 [Burkholderia sp. MSMB617WGS]|nr:hypothetical protein WS78_15660 [Burkholderia savannae]AOK48170.1 hypothetical protein WT60_15865 [Burkholderia sp. MSMB617WGS]KVG43960.1 hypothetical protein WS77_10430 [Burkholderia sp. MSMB0265]KVG83860.1 hypothetical protein WS81_07315 [Burkholderia sp. MSMB2040]KVG94894.1 hypothetical protein WS82_05820 [Burkholderia sp. MSMB2041]KVH00610.1 hypothetical protein WS83_21895 [Burkholderia sp. MSMB2042]KVK81091.1 hypothetical protein WS91_11150 [Burkholderia sp. MSMB1498]
MRAPAGVVEPNAAATAESVTRLAPRRFRAADPAALCWCVAAAMHASRAKRLASRAPAHHAHARDRRPIPRLPFK